MSRDEMRDAVSVVLSVVLILVVVGGVCCWLPWYRYTDCRKVGHAVGYCVIDAYS